MRGIGVRFAGLPFMSVAATQLQRPYVWNPEHERASLWSDIRKVADAVVGAPTAYGAPSMPSHFLGAIVLR